MPSISDKAWKCLRLALDNGAAPGKSESALRMALSIMRKDGVSVDDLRKGGSMTPTEQQRVVVREKVVYRLIPDHMLVPFGKYKGQRVGNVALADPSYLRWMITSEASAKLDPTLRTAIRQVLNNEGI